MTTHEIYLPVGDSPVETLKAYTSLERAIILEIATRFDKHGKTAIGENWFPALMNTESHVKYRSKWKSAWDPTFVFGEILFLGQSPMRSCLPSTQKFFNIFETARRIRNKWAHDFRPRSMTSLHIDAITYHLIAEQADLGIVAATQALVERAKSISEGTWTRGDQHESELPKTQVPADAERQFEVDEAEREAEMKAAEAFDYVRPIVGEAWVGPIPDRRLRLQPKLHDAIDSVTGASIRSELGDLADVTIERWIQIRPNGDLFVAEDDGAVMGWVAGRPRLIGYLGAEPEYDESTVRGFIIPRVYHFDSRSVIDAESGNRLDDLDFDCAATLNATILGKLEPDDELRITTHGDIVRVCDEGIVLVCRVNSKGWFREHILV
jgi:hypothetical protein